MMINDDFWPYFKQMVESTHNDIPSCLLIWLAVVFCIGAIWLMCYFDGNNYFKTVACLLLIEYIIFLFSYFVLHREGLATRSYSLIPFWSYKAIAEGNTALLVEDIMNILAFIPIGVLLGCINKGIRWRNVALMAFGFSVLIEMLQLLFNKGFSELDDVFHNTIGAIVGFGMYAAIVMLVKPLSKRGKA